ncbi:deuterolysin M35 metalloprotease [Pholiota molesta]|nr:deuterolysin M35 metalloprotease [Pholiota molesta]
MITGLDIFEKLEDLRVLATVTNMGNKTMRILNDPRGSLSDFPTDTFKITDRNGVQPRFKGVKLKYIPVVSKAGDYRTIEPGDSVYVEHDLSKAYDFSNLLPGAYNITGREIFYALDNDSKTIAPINASSISHRTQLMQVEQLSTTEARLAKRATYTDCTEEQQSELATATQVAQDYARNASVYANSLTGRSARYGTWFGAYKDKRHDRISSQYSAISSRNFSSFTYDCSCEMESTFAYVYPHDFGHIYLCGAFWDAPMTGTDSKGGTLIHESSHFTANDGGTVDYAYGQPSCQVLALTDPDIAIVNADSHEYFAENNPMLA